MSSDVTLAHEKVNANKFGFQISLGNGEKKLTDSKNASKQTLLDSSVEGCYMSGVGDTSANSIGIAYDRDSTLAVIDTIKTRITDRAKAFKETEIIFYDVSGLREAQKQLNAIVADNQLSIVAPAHLYAIVGATDVKAEFTNNSKNDTYKVEIRRNKDNALIADVFELAAGKSISSLTLLEAPEFGNTDCTVTITAYRDSKEIGSMQTELTLHTAYLWPKEVQ